jgi:hypothetical protein
MAEKDAKPKKSKAKGAKRGKGADQMSVANHPRAGAQISRAKGWGGLAGFLLVGYLSWRAGAPLPDTLLRAIAGGVLAYVLAWAGAVIVWRHLVVAELRAVRSQRLAAARRRAAAAAAQRADAS